MARKKTDDKSASTDYNNDGYTDAGYQPNDSKAAVASISMDQLEINWDAAPGDNDIFPEGQVQLVIEKLKTKDGSIMWYTKESKHPFLLIECGVGDQSLPEDKESSDYDVCTIYCPLPQMVEGMTKRDLRAAEKRFREVVSCFNIDRSQPISTDNWMGHTGWSMITLKQDDKYGMQPEVQSLVTDPE